MDHEDRCPSGEDEWFYEIGGRSHGPLRWAAVEDLLSRCGETALDARIRKGASGTWIPYRPTSQTQAQERETLPSNASASAPVGVSPAARGRSPRQWPARRRWFRLPMPERTSPVNLMQVAIIAAILVWLTSNCVLLFFWPQPHAVERRAVLALERIQAEMNELTRKPPSDTEWNEFCERSKSTLAPVVRDLKTAESSEPVQLLLLACRDFVPKFCSLPARERQNYNWRLQRSLQQADMVLSGLDTN
jgi:hypothetical protein